MTPSRTTLAVVSTLVLAACPRPAGLGVGLGLAPLEEAARRIGATGPKAPRDQALAGFAAYLLDGKVDAAAKLFADAAKASDVWGLYGQLELARRSLDTRERIRTSLKICELAPAHALCALTARGVLAAVGESGTLDAAIEASALRTLATGPRGDAAYCLRLAAWAVRRNRGDFEGAKALRSDAGFVGAATLLGPYSRYHYLEWDQAFAPEKNEAAPGTGPHGAVVPREVRAPDGRLAITSEPTTADIYYWSADAQVAQDARYQLHAVGRGTFRVYVDGALALDQRDFEGWLPEERIVELRLAPGHHRVLAKIARGTEHADTLWLAFARADGAPSRITFAPASGAIPEIRSLSFDPPIGAFADTGSLVAALEDEVGSALAAFVASRGAADRDDEGALALADALVQKKPTAPLLVLRAEALAVSHSLPQRIALGRAHRDLEEALKADPGEASALQRLSIDARGENRLDESAELLEKARLVASPASWRIVLSEMRLAQARGADALADQLAQKALVLEPGLCDALDLRYDLARRLDAVALADKLVLDLGRCPGHELRQAEHLRLRGDLAGARALFEAMAERSPLDASAAQSAAQLAITLNKPQEAAAILERLEKAWPRHPLFHKRRADALDRAGDPKGARAEREAALALDGSDLKLRRALAIEDGKELLEELKTDAAPLREKWERLHGADRPTASGVYIVDASAVEAHADGSFTERTHVLAKVLGQEGIGSLAEVHLPAGAEVLTLRTLKADGRVLEPEEIGGKEGMSLPGVDVGDCVEYEYLHATPARGVAMPGFVAPKFYFQIADGQLFHSTYSVRAPTGLGLAIDPHNMEAPALRHENGWDVVTVTREEMPTFVREPGAPSTEEVLPFVQVGSGAELKDALASMGDFLLDRAKPNAEVARFARDAVAGKQGMAAVRALYEKVMAEVKGPEATLTTRATATLAQGRGSRLVLLKGGLQALHLGSRVVLVKPFIADPKPYRFSGGETYGYAALLVKTLDGEALLTPGIRLAPFDRLAPQAQGQEAVVLPEVGEAPRLFKTAGSGEADGKSVRLTLSLAADGTLSGKGEETYRGMEAAFLKSTLERMNQEQRKQGIESAIARTFDNGSLTDFSIEDKEESGTPVVIRFAFAAPAFARAEPGRLILPRGVYPSNFSRRFLHQFERRTPLLLASPEKLDLEVELALPPGASLDGTPQSAKLESPFGRMERTERAAPQLFSFSESAALGMSRIAPDQYRAFGEFLNAADRAEQREVVFKVAPQGVASADR